MTMPEPIVGTEVRPTDQEPIDMGVLYVTQPELEELQAMFGFDASGTDVPAGGFRVRIVVDPVAAAAQMQVAQAMAAAAAEEGDAIDAGNTEAEASRG